MLLTYIPLPVMSEPAHVEPAIQPEACRKIAQAFAYALVEGDCTGHDRFHLDRVRQMALRLAANRLAADAQGAQGRTQPPLDILVVEIASLLHDAMDSKFSPDPEEQGHRVEALLAAMPMLQAQREHVQAIISKLGFVHTLPQNPSAAEASQASAGLSIEGQIVQDADKLDALGAIGIARCFAFGGRKGQPLHDPDLRPRESLTAHSYRSGKQSSLNHFHEKLFKLKEMLHTPEARGIAEKRHAFLQDFLVRFEAEWEGVDH